MSTAAEQITAPDRDLPAGILDSLRARFSGLVAIAIWPLAALAVVSAAFGNSLPATVAAIVCLPPAAIATFAWRRYPAAEWTRHALGLAALIPALAICHSFGSDALKMAAILGSALVITSLVVWTCERTIWIVGAVKFAHHILALALVPQDLPAIFVSRTGVAVLMTATVVHIVMLGVSARFARRLTGHFEKVIRRSAEAKATIETLAREQTQVAGREKERRNVLKAIITEFDTVSLDSMDHVVQDLSVLKSTAATLSEIANRTNDEVKRAAATSDESSQSITTVAGAVQQLAGSISSINDELSAANALASGIEESARGTNQAVDSFDISIHKIDDIVGLIQAIANQINLLALNATIEAARAGEAGRGFAVVATEVKNLANQTALATQDVTRQIDEIKSAAANAFDSVRTLSGGVREMNKRTMSIADAVQDQDRATRIIHSNLANVADVVRSMASVTDQVWKSSDGTLQIANDVLQSTESIQQKATELETSIHKLLQKIATA
ncbi:MAG: methyl-accepting chemotaxis protein [Beijerinckiaceae bacterium]